MGAPSDGQIDEMIALGLAHRWSEERILKHVADLERMTDEELAAVGVFPPPPRAVPAPASVSPSMSRRSRPQLSPSSTRCRERRALRKPPLSAAEGDKVEEVEEPPNPSSHGNRWNRA
jgi:hypothetical protein